jgi:hypothetical protein
MMAITFAPLAGCAEQSTSIDLNFCELAKGGAGNVGDAVVVRAAALGEPHHGYSLFQADCDSQLDVFFDDMDDLPVHWSNAMELAPADKATVFTVKGRLDAYKPMDNNPSHRIIRVGKISDISSVEYLPERTALPARAFEYPEKKNK